MKNKLLIIAASTYIFSACNSNNSENKETEVVQATNAEHKISLTPDQRYVDLEGGFNCRDLGGIVNKEGRTIKKGLLFRCGNLNGLTSNDIEVIENLKLKTLVDFRSVDEIKEMPNQKVQTISNIYNFPIADAEVMKLIKNRKDVDFAEILINANKRMAMEETFRENFRKFFELVQDSTTSPILYHCTAGKDRTGFATAMILYALGVDEKTIMEDYLVSNKYLEKYNQPILEKTPEVKDLFIVKKEYLEAGINAIKNEYGSVEKYLTDVLKVDLNKMKSMYLN